MSDYTRHLGVGLRRARHQSGLSLMAVQKVSEGSFKASVVGAYERGERAITVEKLHRLCKIYRVHVVSVLPSIDH